MFGLLLAAATAAPAAPVANPDPKHLVVSPADGAKAKSLVEKLASPAYEEREQAQAELSGLGRRAVPALADALARHPSAEVRARCRALYPRARADDLQARLDTFAADEAGKFEHDLPGWADFRLVAGGGKAARKVFADVVAAPFGRELVLGDLPPADLGMRVASRKQEIYNRRFTGARRVGDQPHEPSVADVLALMYAESRVSSRHIPRTATGTVVYTTPTFVAALQAGSETAAVYRAVAGKWVSTRDEALLMTQALAVGTTLELPEVGGLGARMMTAPGVLAAVKAQAAMAVAKVGDPSHLPALEAVFKDESVVGTPFVQDGPVTARVALPVPVLLRDTALAAALLVTGQEPKDYGFEETFGRRDARFTNLNWALRADRRAAAFEKWTAWRGENPDFGKDR